MVLRDLTCKVGCGCVEHSCCAHLPLPSPCPQRLFRSILGFSLSPAVFSCLGLIKLIGKEEEGLLYFRKGHLCHVCERPPCACCPPRPPVISLPLPHHGNMHLGASSCHPRGRWKQSRRGERFLYRCGCDFSSCPSISAWHDIHLKFVT